MTAEQRAAERLGFRDGWTLISLTNGDVYALWRELVRMEEENARMLEALKAIRKGVADSPRPYEGFWPMREFLNDRQIFNGDLDGDAVIVAVIDAAISSPPVGRVRGEK